MKLGVSTTAKAIVHRDNEIRSSRNQSSSISMSIHSSGHESTHTTSDRNKRTINIKPALFFASSISKTNMFRDETTSIKQLIKKQYTDPYKE
jgi:hypothetical protein